MALHSASSIARLHHTNVHSDLVPSIFASGSGNLLVDFAGLCSKSKRARRRLGAFTSRKAFQHYLTKNSSPVKAVLDLERCCKPLDDSATSDPKPQVRIPLIVLRLPAFFFSFYPSIQVCFIDVIELRLCWILAVMEPIFLLLFFIKHSLRLIAILHCGK